MIYTVDICEPVRQMKGFFTFSMCIALRHNFSARCLIDANYICRLLGIFGKNIPFEDTFSIQEGALFDYIFLV
jgi:hypothetical protein